MKDRIVALISSFESKHIDAFLVTRDVNITYLTRFKSHDSWLLVTRRKTFYITDARYTLEARQHLKSTIEVVEFQNSLIETVFKLAQSHKVKVLGFDERHCSLAQYRVFTKKCPKFLKLTAANDLVEQLRIIKDSDEIDKIRQALKIHQSALKYLKKVVKPGLTEKEILWKLENFVRVRDVGFSFDTIIASGPNSCFPHAHVSSRQIKNNEPVLIDMGIDVNGYKSDLTRMFFLGKMPTLVKEVAAHVLQAQQLAIAHIKPGMVAKDIDAFARNYLADKNLAKYFGHSLGHGVGLDIHEAPRLSKYDDTILRPGMVITVEPAVYIPGKFGVRLEEMVLVTDNGCEVISGYID